LNKLTHQIS